MSAVRNLPISDLLCDCVGPVAETRRVPGQHRVPFLQAVPYWPSLQLRTVVLMLGLGCAPVEPRVAASFQFPTEGYEAGSAHGRRYLSPANHLGDDSRHEHLTPVVAIGNGVVRHVRRGGLKGYGSVVAVEHALPDGEVVVSIYGHLCNHEGYRIPVAVGDVVKKGTLLGFIGDDGENGHGPEHIHLGIRRGPYDGVVCGYSGPRGCSSADFHDPTAFINARK